MFVRGLILALFAVSSTLAFGIPEGIKIRVFVETAHVPLWTEISILSTKEFIKIGRSGIDQKNITELNNQVVDLTKETTKKVADSKEALVVSLKEAAKEGADKLEEAKKVALENIEKAKQTIKSKYEELAERIDESIKNIKESQQEPQQEPQQPSQEPQQPSQEPQQPSQEPEKPQQ